MSQYEKLAWFNLAVVSISVAVFLCLIPWLGLFRASGAFGLTALLAAGALFGRRGSDPARVIADERDHGIFSQAQLFAFRVFWMVFGGGVLLLWKTCEQAGAIPVQFLPLLIMAGFVVFMMTQSVAILVLYGRGRRDVQG